MRPPRLLIDLSRGSENDDLSSTYFNEYNALRENKSDKCQTYP
jgi:hypothetical protein